MSFTVLIADDDYLPRKVLQDHIAWNDLSVTEVIQASDGDEALELSQKYRPDIIISDIKMPHRNGLEMAAAVRQFLPNCRFIFLTGYSDKEYLKGAIRLRVSSYVEKPIDLNEITASLREAIDDLKRNCQPDPAVTFFRGGSRCSSPLNTRVYSCEKNALKQLEDLIKHNKHEETMAFLRQMYEQIRLCEGTEPEYVHHLYCQIIFLFLNAAESHNILTITSKTDLLLYSTAKQETLAGLWDPLYQTAELYFSALDCPDPDVATRVERYLQQHYRDCTLTVQQIADDLSFTNTYLCAAYKMICGKTINQRLTELRIQHAQELLMNTSLKLYKVANDVGYSDGKYFAKLFTRETGLSPKQYRRRYTYEE